MHIDGRQDPATEHVGVRERRGRTVGVVGEHALLRPEIGLAGGRLDGTAKVRPAKEVGVDIEVGRVGRECSHWASFRGREGAGGPRRDGRRGGAAQHDGSRFDPSPAVTTRAEPSGPDGGRETSGDLSDSLLRPL